MTNYVLSKNLYRKIKQLNKSQMAVYLESLYNNGISRGLQLAAEKRNIPFNEKELSAILLDDVGGISVEKAEQIIKVLIDKYNIKSSEE
ncbi:MAG: hypothetical protein ACLU23_05375 [Eubacterium sp.]